MNDQGAVMGPWTRSCPVVALALLIAAPAVDECELFDGETEVSSSLASGRSIESVDMDADGDADLLSASYPDGRLAWYENADGAGSVWIDHDIGTQLSSYADVTAVDIDGDNDLDVVAPGFDFNGALRWWENVGGDGLEWTSQIVTSSNGVLYGPVSAGDIDGDGDVDIVAGDVINGQIVWYENLDGLGAFGPSFGHSITKFLFALTHTVALVDMDDDGELDVLIASDDGIAAGLWWMENVDGAGTQ